MLLYMGISTERTASDNKERRRRKMARDIWGNRVEDSPNWQATERRIAKEMMEELYPNNPKCPHARNTSGYCAESVEDIEGTDVCALVDKWCLLDGGLECGTYDKWKQSE